MVMKELVTQSKSLGDWCVFRDFWTTVELYGTAEEDLSGFGIKDKMCVRYIHWRL